VTQRTAPRIILLCVSVFSILQQEDALPIAGSQNSSVLSAWVCGDGVVAHLSERDSFQHRSGWRL